MERERLLAARMRSQLLTAPAGSILEAAGHMLATQAQDFIAGRYALAQRVDPMPNRARVNQLFNEGLLVRSWTMRGTLHIALAEDAQWLVQLAKERTLRSAAARHRELQIDVATIDTAGEVISSYLRDMGQGSRNALFEQLEQHGIGTRNQRGLHLLLALVQQGLLCLGPIPVGAKLVAQDFVLVESWVSKHHAPEFLVQELLARYLNSHGPATLRDAAWYSGQTLTTIRHAAAELGGVLISVGKDERGEDFLVVEGSLAHQSLESTEPPQLPRRLLGPFDEYYLSWANRSHVADTEMQQQITPGKNGMFNAFWLEDGRASRLWDANIAPADSLGATLHQRYSDFRATN
ncbi:winged helix DNA-binding domain-containing protein [Arthrobacter sp. NIO-1057]|uniref:winged helix DNA-binding domain-containing protein n=1 Tax=Arthrobacter sp. NIO-1057 TaxID=993071 RepID=UPI000818188C|nr:winged helix DNA-binding domain-containing protein [Arthrobacter sp. NIO-1057]SCB80381.1 Winged helix DNA-binding domain-containing protein [Arthrobacter sp. NIO-1057]